MHCGHDPFALWEVRTFGEIQYMVEAAGPYHMRPYETLGTLLEGFGGKGKGKGRSKGRGAPAEASDEDVTAEQKNASLFAKLRRLGFAIQTEGEPPPDVEALIPGVTKLP